MRNINAISAVVFLLISLGAAQDIVRLTDYGPVRGVLKEVDDSVFIEQYLGIPYAAPPIGDLRWRPPQRHPGWADQSEPLDASDYRAFCPQGNTTGSYTTMEGNEDCLHLNIYVPNNTDSSMNSPLSVFFWIHGGGYVFGYSNFYDSPLAWYSDVIVVTINYRLGALGFLSTGDSHSPGNFGMLDMIAALRWVKENIENFGGDKNKITIGGESVGAGAVELLSLSDSLDVSSDTQLFHRIISQSGGAFSDSGLVTNMESTTKAVFRSLSCPTFSNMLAMECMRKKSLESIFDASLFYAWGPVVDGDLFTDTPQALSLNEENRQRMRGRYDYLIGSNLFDSPAVYSNVNRINDSDSFLSFMQTYLTLHFNDPAKIADAVYFNYIDWTKELPANEDEWKILAMRATRDYDILSPSRNFSTIASAKDGFDSNVYYYQFTPRPSVAVGESAWAYNQENQFDWVTGARHAEELAYSFGVVTTIEGATESEIEVSLQMMKYWGNFIRTGNPNVGLEVATEWPSYNYTGSYYMILGTNNATSTNVTEVGRHLETNKVVFWTNEVPLYDGGTGLDDGFGIDGINATDPRDPVVNTTLGAVKGLRLKREDYIVDRFFRIPYAAPPEGLLRFQPPQPHPGWDGVRDCSDRSSAKQWLHICPQRNIRGNGNVGQENCLYLNIWVPGGVTRENEELLPVMVWIYGGGNNIGTSIGFTFYYDMEYLVTQGAVVGVTLNYRLNSLGFLSTGDENLPGNMGLMDQAAALQWVQDNIKQFGGDPEKVTIFGQSAGGADVSAHMISPVSENLFLRGISESGCLPSTWTYGTNPLAQAERLATNLGCPTNNTKLLVACLRDKPLKKLISASVGIGWGTVIDGYFVPGDPKYTVNASRHKDYIMGQNSMEGHGFMSGFFPKLNMKPDNPLSNMGRDDVRRASRIFDIGVPPHVSEAVAYKFIQWEEPEQAYLWPRLAITDMSTDWTFGAGSYIAANIRAESNGTGRTYLYILGEKSRVSLFPDWVESNHLRELVYVFGHPFEEAEIAKRFNDSDRVLSKAVMTYWTNFARTGNPNSPNIVDIPIEWPEYELENKYSILFNTSMADDPEKYVRRNYRGDIMHMWREIMYKMWDLPLETCPAKKQRKTSIPPSIFHVQKDSVTFADCGDDPFVRSTEGGCVEGYGFDWDSSTVERYLGIPYAEPPVGSLRFQNPVEHTGWSDVLSAKNFSKICPQSPYSETEMDEDCLYLCVYVPQTSDTDALGVLVWIHGGKNQLGNGMESYTGDALATLGNIIVVTINYRLGSLGYLTTDDEAAKGNYGLMDQYLAIKWVKNNIENFGGDPDRITIAGQSSGAESSLLHSLSPLTQSLNISRSIMESPPILPYDDMKQLDSAIKLAEEASCDTSSGNNAMVECLRQLSITGIIAAQERTALDYLPTIDGTFLPDSPRALAEDETRVKQWQYLMGVNDGDGSVVWNAIKDITDEEGYRNFIKNTYYDTYEWRTSSIDEQYAHYEDSDFFQDQEKIQKTLIQLRGDEAFIFSTHKLAIDYSSYGADVFFYYFTYARPRSSGPPQWVGAMHIAEIPLVFGYVLNDPTEQEDVKQLSRDMIEYWSNFVKNGDVNSNGPFPSTSVKWSKFKTLNSDRNYIVLDLGNLTTAESNLRPTDDAFWNDYMLRQSVFCEAATQPTTAPGKPPIPEIPESPSVPTTHGPLLGKRVTNEHFDVHTFMGIPYAKPPIEELRFAKTSQIPAWSSTFDATKPKPPCIQLNTLNEVIGSEDCLYLDVFLPVGIVESNTNSLPVMVWVHGGADVHADNLGGSFWAGGGSPDWDTTVSTIDPSYLSYFGNVMIVRPNYRLGALGFLTTGDDVMKGNYGLWDLQAAVEWTAKNAQNFGGDPNTLTVFGHGSGAALAELLGALPSSSQYVKRVITQSGSVFSPWTFCLNDMTCGNKAQQVGDAVGCQGDSEDILECLKTVPSKDILKSVPYVGFTNKDVNYNAFGTWRLRQDGDLIPKGNLSEVFADAKYDHMTGTTSHEFHRYLEVVYGNTTSLETSIAETSRFLRNSAVEDWPDEAYALLLHSYTPWEDSESSELKQESAVKYYGDLLFAAGSGRSLSHGTTFTGGNSYQYVLTRYLGAGDPQEWIGGRHGDDVIYQFGIPISSPGDYSEEDREFSRIMMSHWANFAWSGDPNTAFSSKNWRPYGMEAYFTELGTGGRNLFRRPAKYNVEKNSLWNDVIPDISPSIPQLETTAASHTLKPTEDIPKTTEVQPCAEEIPPIGEGIGLSLTPEEADTAIYALFSVCLILGIFFILIIVVWFVKAQRVRKDDISGNGHRNRSYSGDNIGNQKANAGEVTDL